MFLLDRFFDGTFLTEQHGRIMTTFTSPFRPDVSAGPFLRRDVPHLWHRGAVLRGQGPGGQDRSHGLHISKVNMTYTLWRWRIRWARTALGLYTSLDIFICTKCTCTVHIICTFLCILHFIIYWQTCSQRKMEIQKSVTFYWGKKSGPFKHFAR